MLRRSIVHYIGCMHTDIPRPIESQTSSSQVLIIDDDDQITVHLRDRLLEHGHPADCAKDAVSAIRFLASHHYSLVVVDCYLTGEPVRNAGRLLERIRRLQPTATIVLLTAYSFPDLLAQARSLGVALAIDKPQPVSLLVPLLERMIDGPTPRMTNRRSA